MTTTHKAAWTAYYAGNGDYPGALFPDVPQHLIDAINTIGTPEGWALFDCDGSANGPMQIQSFDDGEPVDIGGDDAAWMLVWSRAHAGSQRHLDALLVVAVSNQLEYLAIVRWVATHQLPATTRPHHFDAVDLECAVDWACDGFAGEYDRYYCIIPETSIVDGFTITVDVEGDPDGNITVYEAAANDETVQTGSWSRRR